MTIPRAVKTISSVFFILPIVLYTAQLAYEMIYAWMKHGWASRPFVYVGLDSALVYLVYGLLYLQTLNFLNRQGEERTYKICFGFALVAIAIYWVGMLTIGLGISSR